METEYETCLFDYLYMETCLQTLGINALIEDSSYIPLPDIRLLANFHLLASTRLTMHPSHLAEELWARMANTDNNRVKKLLQQAVEVKKQRQVVWLRPKFACMDSPGGTAVRSYQYKWEIDACTLSPDNKRMITLSKNKLLTIWDVESGKILRTANIDNDIPRRVSYSPDGSRFAVVLSCRASAHGDALIIRVFNSSDCTTVCDLQAQMYNYIVKTGTDARLFIANSVFTNDGRAIIVKDVDGKVKLLDSSDGKLISSIAYEHEAYVFGVGGKSIVAVGNMHPDRNSEKWELPWIARTMNPIGLFDYDRSTQQLIPRSYSLEGHSDSVERIAVSHDDKMVASVQRGKVKIWDATTATLLGEIEITDGGLADVNFLNDSKQIAVGDCSGGIIRIYNITPELVCAQTIVSGHFASIHFFSSTEPYCLVRTSNNMKLISLNPKMNAVADCSDSLVCIRKNDNQKIIVASSYANYVESGQMPRSDIKKNGHLHFFDMANNKYLYSRTLRTVQNQDMVFLDGSGTFAVSKQDVAKSYKAVIKYWLLENTMEDDEFTSVHFTINDFVSREIFGCRWHERIRFAQFSSDCKYVIVLESDKHTLAVYKTSNGRLLNRIVLRQPYSNRLRDSFRLLFKGIFVMPSQLFSNISNIDNTAFEVSSDGKLLFMMDITSKHLSWYDIPLGKHIKTISLEHTFSNSLQATELRLTLLKDRKKLLVDDSSMMSIIDLETEMIIVAFDRRKNKQGKEWADFNAFTSVNKESTMLCLSRALCDATTDDEDSYLTRYECIEVRKFSDTELIAKFYPEGHATNIIIENNTFTFGMGNGKICTLVLENYNSNT